MRTRRYRKGGGIFDNVRQSFSGATEDVNNVGAKMNDSMSTMSNFFSEIGAKAKNMVKGDTENNNAVNNSIQPTLGGKRRKGNRKRTKKRSRR